MTDLQIFTKCESGRGSIEVRLPADDVYNGVEIPGLSGVDVMSDVTRKDHRALGYSYDHTDNARLDKQLAIVCQAVGGLGLEVLVNPEPPEPPKPKLRMPRGLFTRLGLVH
jgi:hypothetical protein